MKLAHVVPIVLLVSLVSLAEAPPGIYLIGSVTEVPEGDTLVIAVDGTTVTVEISGVVAAPVGVAEGDRAQARLVELVYLREVTVRVESLEGYPSVRGTVQVAEEDVGSLLLSEGLVERSASGAQMAQLGGGDRKQYRSSRGLPYKGPVYELSPETAMPRGVVVIESDEQERADARAAKMDAEEARRTEVTHTSVGGHNETPGGNPGGILGYTVSNGTVIVDVATDPSASGNGAVLVRYRDGAGVVKEMQGSYSWAAGQRSATVRITLGGEAQVVTVIPR